MGCLKPILFSLLFLISLLLLSWYYHDWSIDDSELPGTYVSKQNLQDSLIIINLKSKIYYLRKYKNKKVVGLAYNDNDYIDFNGWEIYDNEFDTHYYHSENKTITLILQRRNLFSFDLTQVDWNGDKIGNYGYNKVSDKISKSNLVYLFKNINYLNKEQKR